MLGVRTSVIGIEEERFVTRKKQRRSVYIHVYLDNRSIDKIYKHNFNLYKFQAHEFEALHEMSNGTECVK